MEKCILVPFDFSNEANYSLDHAYQLARIPQYPIHMIFVVDKESQVAEWQEELQKIADEYAKKYNYPKFVPVVKAGNLFKTIYNYGVESNAYVAVMGTHGLKTINRAMKVIKGFVKIPFILVQRPLNYGDYDKICVPIDGNKKSRAKFLWVKYLNQLFESKVFIVYPEEKDSMERENINRNILFATSIFADDGIDFEAKSLPKENYADNLYDYMAEIKPDIVLFMTDKYKEHITKLKRPRNIELYKKIPIMCVNPRTDIVKLGGFSY